MVASSTSGISSPAHDDPVLLDNDFGDDDDDDDAMLKLDREEVADVRLDRAGEEVEGIAIKKVISTLSGSTAVDIGMDVEDEEEEVDLARDWKDGEGV